MTKPPLIGRAKDGSRKGRGGGGRRRVPALGYASVSAEQPLDGPEIEAQRKNIERACRQLGLDLIDIMRDHEPDGSESEPRPGLLYALERIDASEATCLVVSDLGRLSGDTGGLAQVLDRLEKDDARLVAVDVALDTETIAGRLAVARRPGLDAAPKERVVAPPAIPDTPVVPPPEVAPAGTGKRMRALGYASVPAKGEDATAEALEAQRQLIERHCERLGLELVEVVSEREPKAGKTLDRAGVTNLIERLAAGDASCLIVSGLDRLGHSAAELGTLVQWLEQSSVRLVAVELDLDTLSPAGRATARAIASVGSSERERLSRRTGGGGAGPDWAAIRKRIAVMRADGMTLQAIADVLNQEQVPTPRGGVKWRPSSVQTAAGYKRRSRAKGVDDLPAKHSDHS
jgi:DNA invertase Pin-like site-specific DNA recombinase